MTLCGGFSNERDATPEEQEILETVKAAVEAQKGRSYAHFQAVKFATQVVAGVNYLMKVKADDEVLHVKIAKPLPHTGQAPFLLAVDAAPQSETSALAAFA